MSYGSNVTDLWTRAAECVDKILRGAKPGDLPVGSRLSFSSSSISRRPKRSSG
jgi:putative ABC transport system substrate-binding protein